MALKKIYSNKPGNTEPVSTGEDIENAFNDNVDEISAEFGKRMVLNSALIDKTSAHTWASIFDLPYDNFRLRFNGSYPTGTPDLLKQTEINGSGTSFEPIGREYEVQRVGRNGLIFQFLEFKWAFTSDGGARKDASLSDLVAYLANYYTKSETNALYPKLTVGKNLFNKNASGIIDGKYLTTAGAENINASFFISEYIHINPSTAYISSNFNMGGAFYCFYDSSKVLISGASVNTAGFTTPSNASYVRLSGEITGKSLQQLELGATATVYEAYILAVPISNIPIEVAKKTDLPDLSPYQLVSNIGVSYPSLMVGKNLFNKNASGIIDGKYLGNIGNQVTNASFFITDYIPINPSTAYIGNNFNIGGAFCCFYDVNKGFISSFQTSGFTSPSNAYYVRMSGTVTDKAIQQLELGTVATFYESYSKAVIESNVPLSIARKLDIDTLINSTPQFPRFVTGKNLFNHADSGVKRGYYLLATNAENANSSYSITGYIPITTGQVVKCNKNVGGGAYNVFYDAFKNPLAVFNSSTSPSAPTGAAYVRYSISVTAAESISAAQVQVELGTSSTTFEAYYSFLLDAALPLTIARKTDLIPYLQKKSGKNLFNPSDADILVGYYISPTGTINSNIYGYNVTGFIPISSGQTLKANWSMANTYAALYDVNKNYISSTAVNANSIVWQTGAVYARFSYNISTINNQVEVGTVSTAYEEYSEYLPVAQLKAQTHDRDVQPILPAKMYFVKGKESCLYYENVLLKNMNDSTTLFVNKGYNYNRLCQFNFAAAATNQTMTLQVLRSLKKGLLKSITYNVKDPATNNGKTVNVLFIGDSFTDIGTYVKEVKTLMALDGVTVNLLGTNGNSTFKAEGLSGGAIADTLLNTSRGVAKLVQVIGMTTLPSSDYPGTFYSDSNGNQWLIRGGKISGGSGHIRVTKTSGAVIGDFATFPSSGTLTKIDGAREGDATISYSTPTDAYHNPFINPSTGLLDMAYYLSSNSFANPDIINIQFTWNDLATWLSDASIAAVVANFKTAVDHIHSVLASAKIVLSIEPFGSLNGNLDWNGKKYSVLRFSELMIAQFETDVNYSSFVIVAPSYAFVDLVYGYSSSTATPSARYAITEQSGGDGTHPTTVGMKQISDCLFQIFHNII